MDQSQNDFSISIILPNYNGTSLLRENLPSIKKAAGYYKHEIIVVDDASDDDSLHFLEQNYPDIIVIKNQLNQGFSCTCNKGIKAASMNFVCIVNTDVTFDADYFVNAEKSFTAADIFAVKGDIINYRENFNDVSVIEKTFLLYYKRGHLRFNPNVDHVEIHDSPDINTQFVLLGCCFVCRREVLQQLGGYDEIYSPFYWEDSDLSMRALEEGYRLIYNSDCKVYHQLSATISNYRSNTERRLISTRNKFIFTWKHLKGLKNWAVHITYLLLNLLTRWVTLDWMYYIALMMALRSIKTKPTLKGN